MRDTFNVSFPGLGIDNLEISRIAFSIFGVDVYWYGLLISLSVVLCLILAQKSAHKYGLSPDTVADTFLAIVPLMIIFARLYYVVFALDEFSGNFFKIFNLRTGGLAFYGGVIGGVLAILLIAGIRKTRVSLLMDHLAVYLPLAQGIGRWGNFFNQEAFGTNTSLPWGMISQGTANYLEITGAGDPSLPVHPTFLYEFIGNMIIFGILLQVRKKSGIPYETTLVYLMLYGLLRFFVEAVRTDALYIGNTDIRISMLLSGLMFLFGAGMWLFFKKMNKVSHKKNEKGAEDIE